MDATALTPQEQAQVPPAEAAAIEKPVSKDSGHEAVDRLHDDVRETLTRAESVRDQIKSIELSTGDTPRLQEIRKQSEEVFKKIEQLVFALLDTDRTIADQERLQGLAQSAQADLKAINKPLRRERKVALKRELAAQTTPTEPSVESAAPVEPQPEPVIIEPTPTEEQPAPQDSYDRDAFWREMKSKLGEREAAEHMQKQVQEQLNGEILPELQRILTRIELGNSKQEKPEQLIATIVALQTELGGEVYANQVREKLEKWTDKPQDRTLFDSPVGPMAFSDVKRKTGAEGLDRSLRLAKAKKATLSTMEGITNKLSEKFGLSEVQTLEKRKQILLSAIDLTMDKLIARMQDENKLESLTKRKVSLSQTEESITRQVNYDRELAEYIADAEELDRETQQAHTELKNFVLRLDPQARDLLADTLPATIPANVADHMSLRDRQTYAQLVSNYEHLRTAFDNSINKTRKLYTGGLAGYERNLVSEALQGAQYEVEDDFSTEPANLETPDRPRRLAADDIKRFAKSEVDIAREKTLAEWTTRTEKEIMDLVKKNHDALLAQDPRANDLETFLAYHMPNEGLRIMMLLNRLEGSIVTAETTDEIEDAVTRKQELLVELDKILREQPLRTVAPWLDTRTAPRKPLDGTKTLSPEEAEIAEQNAITDTKAPEYAKPVSAKKPSGFDTMTPEYAQRKIEQDERDYANEQFWNYALALSTLYHDKLGALTHSELLAHTHTWDQLRALDSMITSGKKLTELTDDDKKAFITAAIRLHDEFRPNQPFDATSSTYMDHEGTGAREINEILGILHLSDAEAIALAGTSPRTREATPPPQSAMADEAEVIPFPAAEPAKPRVRKPLSASEARAAAQRKPRKTPPRSVQSTRRPSVAA